MTERPASDGLYSGDGAQAITTRIRHNTESGSLNFTELLLRLLAPNDGMKVLDVGCGTGVHLTAVLDACSVAAYGVDPYTPKPSDERILFSRSGVEALPYAQREFDRVMSNYAIYYVGDDALGASVGELLRVLRRPGRLLITGPGPENNRELYDMHAELFGPPSEYDVRAPGFIRTAVAYELSRLGAPFSLQEYWNKVRFRDASIFTDYYLSTTLFRMTVPTTEREGAQKRVEAWYSKRFGAGNVFENAKHIDAVLVDL